MKELNRLIKLVNQNEEIITFKVVTSDNIDGEQWIFSADYKDENLAKHTHNFSGYSNPDYLEKCKEDIIISGLSMLINRGIYGTKNKN